MIGRLILVRHGQSLANSLKKGKFFLESEEDAQKIIKYGGDFGCPLTFTGIDQVKTIKGKLEVLLSDVAENKVYVISSPFRRAKDTSESFIYNFRLSSKKEVIEEEAVALRERSDGYAYCMTKSEVEKTFPWYAKEVFANGFFVVPPGGESMLEVVDRVYPYVKNLLARVDLTGQSVLVFGHGQSLLAMQGAIEGWNIDELQKAWEEGRFLENCEALVYERNVFFNGLKYVKNLKCD